MNVPSGAAWFELFVCVSWLVTVDDDIFLYRAMELMTRVLMQHYAAFHFPYCTNHLHSLGESCWIANAIMQQAESRLTPTILLRQLLTKVCIFFVVVTVVLHVSAP